MRPQPILYNNPPQHQWCIKLAHARRISKDTTGAEAKILQLFFKPILGARLRGRTVTQRSKKGSEKVLGRVRGRGSQKGSEKRGLFLWVEKGF